MSNKKVFRVKVSFVNKILSFQKRDFVYETSMTEESVVQVMKDAYQEDCHEKSEVKVEVKRVCDVLCL